jgi:phage protein D
MSQGPGVPKFKLVIGSNEYGQADGVVHTINVESHVDMVGMLIARFSLGEHQGAPVWNFGDAVECTFGDASSPIFSGEIVAIEPSFSGESLYSIVIRAMEKTHRLGRGRVTRIFEEQKDSDVVSTVAGESGLSVEAEATNETHSYILQRNESNLAFLKRLAARNNYQLRVADNKVVFKKAQYDDGGPTLTMGEDLISLKINYNTSDLVTQVVVRGWDPASKAEVVGTADINDVDAIGDGDMGMASAANFGENIAYITDVPVSSQAVADAIAKAEINRLARQFARGQGKVHGNNEVIAGGMVTFARAPTGSNGSFHVLSCRHVVGPSSGWITEFTFCGTSYGTAPS